MNRLRLLLMCAGVALVATSCTLPTDSAAHPFNDSTNAPSCTGPASATIYFVSENPDGTLGNRLVGVRRLHIAQQKTVAECALQALDNGPTIDEVVKSIATAFPINPEGLSVTIDRDVATVSLDANFVAIADPRTAALAYGQVVWTLVSAGAGITAVQFDLGENPYPNVLLPSGVLQKSGLVRLSDYCSIGPVDKRCPRKA